MSLLRSSYRLLFIDKIYLHPAMNHEFDRLLYLPIGKYSAWRTRNINSLKCLSLIILLSLHDKFEISIKHSSKVSKSKLKLKKKIFLKHQQIASVGHQAGIAVISKKKLKLKNKF